MVACVSGAGGAGRRARDRVRGIRALAAAYAVLLTTPGCIMWDGFVPRETVVLPASDLGASPRLMASWEAASVAGPDGLGDGAVYAIPTGLHLGTKEGEVIALSGDGVRILDSSGRLERTERFAARYFVPVLFDGAGGAHAAGLHGPAETRELHVLPLDPLDALGEREPYRWECADCFRLAAADFSGNGLDSVVVLRPEPWEDDSPWWRFQYPWKTGIRIFGPFSGTRPGPPRLVKSDHNATRIAPLDLEGDGQEEIILFPKPSTTGYLYTLESLSVVRGDGRIEPLMGADRNKNRSWQRLRWRRAAQGRGGYVPVRSGPDALFAKVSRWSIYLHTANAEGEVLSTHRLPADITLHRVVGWHETDLATIVVFNREHFCDIPMAPCASLIVELGAEGELREIARHEAFISATALTPEGHLLVAEHQFDSTTRRRTVAIRDYGPMGRPR